MSKTDRAWRITIACSCFGSSFDQLALTLTKAAPDYVPAEWYLAPWWLCLIASVAWFYAGVMVVKEGVK